MRVALDATYSLGRDPSGVAVYCSRLIQALAQTAPEDHFYLCYRANRFLRSFGSPRPGVNCSRRLLEEAAGFLLPRSSDVFHGLNQRLPNVASFRRTVTTFHDLFVISGDYSTREFRERFASLARDAARRSDHIIAISQFTADQVVDLLGYPREQITVIHHGVEPIPEFSDVQLESCRRRHGLEGPSILHVGAIQKRKNIARLVEAFETLPPRYSLLLAGARGYGAREIIDQIERSPARSRIHLLGYQSRPELELLYRVADVLAFPSLAEGFGLPVLEAMSAGLPVVVSTGSALEEVAADAALKVAPEDTEGLANALLKGCEETALRNSLIESGHARAAKFRWEFAAEKTLRVYRDLATRLA